MYYLKIKTIDSGEDITMTTNTVPAEGFKLLVEQRRSANNFDETVRITREELNEIFQLAKLAPSAYNLQHTRYVVVDEEELKLKLKKAAYGQHKVGTASAAIIVLGDVKGYEKAQQIYEGQLHLGIMDQQQYDQTLQTIQSSYESNERFQRDEAIRSASLSAMMLMLAAKSRGWDTCPMIGYDEQAVQELLHIPGHLAPVMMITIGKEKTNHPRIRGYRRPIGEFVQYGAY